MIVPKHGHDIVDRNRLKRRLREVGRTAVLPRLRTEGLELDLLVRVRPGAYRAGFGRLKEELTGVTEEVCSAK